ncbi:threonine/serine ThrE exporter family protein [Blastococcus sp. PRF04-17]|uniref:threonine/serine ThrE exporter family protein n=1 Tax=Blastococcus sp. PRF04-17 TaxID=2933797 RepID=UPI001FF41318|nr:threonine/serine exporter family protein [Blastococcus sp. PRF04-17]UOY01324.1 threonine/serine exporter family protein [Blastococcus sp. PRF04-17]
MSPPSPTTDDAPLALDLTLRVGDLLLAGGASAAEVTATCIAVARAGGLHRVECDITFTSITVSASPRDGTPPINGLRLVQHRELDYSRVAAVHHVVTELTEGRIDPAEAERRLLAVAAGRHPYRRVVITGARALLAAAVALMLGAGPLVTAAAFGATVLIDLAIDALGRRGLPAFFQNAVGGLIATSVALGFVAAGVGVRPALVVAGGIVLLLPGVTLVGAVHDAITGFYVTAAARAFETLLLTAGIVSGIAVALSIGVRLGVPAQLWDTSGRGLADVPLQLAAAATASAAFAVANHAPRRTIPAVAVAGAAGWGTVVALGEVRVSTTLASAGAAVVIGAASYALARWQRVPALVYIAAGIIPLLPGLTIYRAVRRLSEGDAVGGITLLGTAMTVGLALAAGTLLGEYFAQAAARNRSSGDHRLVGLILSTATRRRMRSRRSAPAPTVLVDRTQERHV